MADLQNVTYGEQAFTIPTYDDTALANRVSANETAIADRYTKEQTDEKIAEGIATVDSEHFHPVTVLPDVADAKENHEYILIEYEQDGVTIKSKTFYLFYDGAYHEDRAAGVSLEGYATEQYVDDGLDTKQDTLTFDDVPTENSDNPVKSSGIKTALDAKQDELTAGQGIRIENSEIDTPLLDSEYFTKGAVLLPDETGNFILGSDRKISYGEWSDTEFYAAGMALSDFWNYVLEFNTPNGADLYAVTSVSAEETDQYGTSVRIDLQNHDGGTMESIIAKLRTDLSTITFSFGSRGVVATSFSVHERRDVRNVSGIVNEDLDVASKTDLASGVAEAKAYADGKTLSATGWGVVTTGRGEIGSAGNPKVIDVSQYNFASADDYEVAVTSLNNNCNVACTAKTATSFTVVGSGWGQSVGERPFSYVITAKGYGAVAYTGALPEGGTADQVLTKRSDADGDYYWKNKLNTYVVDKPEGTPTQLGNVVQIGSLMRESGDEVGIFEFYYRTSALPNTTTKEFTLRPLLADYTVNDFIDATGMTQNGIFIGNGRTDNNNRLIVQQFSKNNKTVTIRTYQDFSSHTALLKIQFIGTKNA